MLFVTGDIHGPHDIAKLNTKNFPEGKGLTKDDYVVCTGDFGLIWDVNKSTKGEAYLLDWLTEVKPWTTLFVDGNHENFDRLYELPVIDKFGGKVGKVNDSIYHLRRGEVYNILDKKIFTFGGADSIDKLSRIVNISWWKEEIPSYKEVHHALDNIEENDYNVDYIFTHTCPISVANQIRAKYDHYKIPDQVELMLEDFNKKLKFKEWYFGHWHIDDVFEDKYFCQYQAIKKLS